MIREYLYNLIVNGKFLDLFFILIFYIINYIVLFNFGSRINRSIFISGVKNKIIRTSIIMGLIGIFFKPIITESLFLLINSTLMILIMTYYFEPNSLKIFWQCLFRSGWAWIVNTLIMGVSVTLICQPLMLIFKEKMFTSTFGIICGTIIEFLPILILLIIFRKKEGRKINEKK